jgi:hypothetical protein
MTAESARPLATSRVQAVYGWTFALRAELTWAIFRLLTAKTYVHATFMTLPTAVHVALMGSTILSSFSHLLVTTAAES